MITIGYIMTSILSIGFLFIANNKITHLYFQILVNVFNLVMTY